MARIGASGNGGSTSVAGNDTDIQYNNAGVLAGSDNFTFDGSNVDVPNGVISAVDFIFSRLISIGITIPDGMSMINSNPQFLGSVSLTLLGDAEFILL